MKEHSLNVQGEKVIFVLESRPQILHKKVPLHAVQLSPFEGKEFKDKFIWRRWCRDYFSLPVCDGTALITSIEDLRLGRKFSRLNFVHLTLS